MIRTKRPQCGICKVISKTQKPIQGSSLYYLLLWFNHFVQHEVISSSSYLSKFAADSLTFDEHFGSMDNESQIMFQETSVKICISDNKRAHGSVFVYLVCVILLVMMMIISNIQNSFNVQFSLSSVCYRLICSYTKFSQKLQKHQHQITTNQVIYFRLQSQIVTLLKYIKFSVAIKQENAKGCIPLDLLVHKLDNFVY